MSNLPSSLFERADTAMLAEHAAAQLSDGRMMAKYASAALIVANNGDVFIAAHEGRDGEFAQGSLGTLMETYRRTPEYGDTATETALEAFRRGISEELGALNIFGDVFNKAGFYFDRRYPVSQEEWSAGAHGGFKDYFGWVTSLVVRVERPEVLISSRRLSEELLWTDFWPIDAILASRLPKRPGFDTWLQMMKNRFSMPLPPTMPVPLRWEQGPLTDKDVKYPFVA